mmetsp:Transcript_8785/g.12468  ORF Transcript_8785/g.12468 Transcript_8785/m.12468 type:complete len:367 (-) Transcript_8785:178-1278(-)
MVIPKSNRPLTRIQKKFGVLSALLFFALVLLTLQQRQRFAKIIPTRTIEKIVIKKVPVYYGVKEVPVYYDVKEVPVSNNTVTDQNFGRVQHQFNDCLLRIDNVRGIKLYSQNDEDGALLQTLRCMGGHGTKEYFEFGSEGGTEVNTRILRDLYQWKGHLLDGSHENAAISLHKEFFTPTNIVSLLQKYEVSKNLDVLSVDCDYDDFYVTREILLAGYKPRVLITEFNINFGSDWAVSIFPKPVGKEVEVGWKLDCYFGASALGMIYLAQAFGYTPVFSNYCNLIFVRLDQALEMNMIIPSINNFPRPQQTNLHMNCPGKTWKLIDSETMKSKATNSSISHTEFAAELPEVTLKVNVFDNWRVFEEQ